jgi:hypothetical protein
MFTRAALTFPSLAKWKKKTFFVKAQSKRPSKYLPKRWKGAVEEYAE